MCLYFFIAYLLLSTSLSFIFSILFFFPWLLFPLFLFISFKQTRDENRNETKQKQKQQRINCAMYAAWKIHSKCNTRNKTLIYYVCCNRSFVLLDALLLYCWVHSMLLRVIFIFKKLQKERFNKKISFWKSFNLILMR